MTGIPPEPGPTGRMRAFRIIAAVVGASGVAYGLYTAVYGIVAESQRIHAFHNVVLATLVLVLTAPFAIAAFRDPRHSAGPLMHLLVLTGAGAVTMVLALTLDPYTLPVLVAIVALWLLHPNDEPILGPGRPSPLLLVLALAAAVPVIAYALTQAELQRVDTSVHADFFHWVETSFTALSIPLVGVLVAFRPSMFRMSAWSAAIAAAVLGTASLLLPSYASSFNTPWAWTAIAGGFLFVVLAEWEGRRARLSGS